MNMLLQKLKEKDYIIQINVHKAALGFSGAVAVMNLLFFFVLTPRWVSGSSQFGPSPQMVPNLLTIGMFICAVVVFLTELRIVLKKKHEKDMAMEAVKTGAKKVKATVVQEVIEAEEMAEAASEAAAEEPAEDGENFFEELLEAAKSDLVTLDLRGVLFILAVVAAALFYVFCSDYLGFILTIIIIMVGLMLLYGVRKPLTIIIATLVMSIGIYYAFSKLLGLALPVGVPLPAIARFFKMMFTH